MINRSDTLIYTKRFYFFPFKPMLDYEYKKFGYKKCDVDKGKNPFFNTVYYVHHKERPTTATFSLLYGLNYLLSFYRTLVFPILIATLILSMLIEGTIGIDCMLVTQFLLIILTGPLTLASVGLSNAAYDLAKKEDFTGKTDRALKSRGWTLWSSYKDNDPRFCPPGVSKKTNTASAYGKQTTQPKPTSGGNGDDEERIVLQTANGENIEFSLIATIANRGKLYVLLVPVEPIEGLDDDEALVFACVDDGNGNTNYVIEEDDTIVDEVMSTYNQLYDEAHS